jgi:8-oxo-dGTP pyrophosphatase MutT (NUDIX family)
MSDLPKAAVCVFAFSGNKILAVTRPHTEIWSLPGGKVDYGEDAISAIQREMAEETGLYIPTNRFHPVYSEVVSGDDGKDYYCTAFWTDADLVDPRQEWLIEDGVKANFIGLNKLLETGAFSDYNERALDSLRRVKRFKDLT